jgi:hypothetical protein
LNIKLSRELVIDLLETVFNDEINAYIEVIE